MHPYPNPAAKLSGILLPSRLADSKRLLSTNGLELTYNGRGALLRACMEIASRGKLKILLPAYHCPSGITPAIYAGLHPVFYRIRRDLSVDLDDLYAKVDTDTGAILVIHFFGIATDMRPLQCLRERGISLIEDWSHSFLHCSPLRLAGGQGDYCVYSFWKLAPSMIGGGLWRRHVEEECDLPMRAVPLRERLVHLKRMLE